MQVQIELQKQQQPNPQQPQHQPNPQKQHAQQRQLTAPIAAVPIAVAATCVTGDSARAARPSAAELLR
jgi:hypothetical protein